MNIEEAVTAYISERRRNRSLTPGSVKTTRYQLLQFADTLGRGRPVNDAQRLDVTRWINECGDAGHKPRTLRSKVSAVANFYKWCALNGLADHDPTFGVQLAKLDKPVPRALTRVEVAAALAACQDVRERLIVSLEVQEGLRAREVAELMVGDIDRQRGQLTAHGKGQKDRVVPLTQPTSRSLSDYLAAHPAPPFGRVIRSLYDDISPVSAGHISVITSRILYRAGVKSAPWDRVSGHAFRHTAASDVLAESGDLQAVQAFLGHSSISTTEVYLRTVSSDRLRAAVIGRDYEAEAS